MAINPCEQLSQYLPRKSFQTLKSQNSELFKRINSLKTELSTKTDAIKKLLDEKESVEEELKATTEKFEKLEVSFEISNLSFYFIFYFFL